MAKRRSLSIDDLFRVRLITSVSLSPDGMHAVATVSSTDEEKGTNTSTLWLYRRGDDSFEQITNGPADAGAQWLDDCSFVFSARKRAKEDEDKEKPFPRTRLYTMSVRGGEPGLRATLDGKVWEMAASPDGARLALAYTPHPEAGAKERQRWARVAPPVVPQHLRWKLDAVGALPQQCAAVHVLDTKRGRWGQPRRLTEASTLWESGLHWVDGERILYLRRPADEKSITTDMALVDQKGRTKTLPSPLCVVTGATPSPDGRWIAFTGSDDEWRASYLPASLHLRSTDPDDESSRLLAATDGKLGYQSTLSDVAAIGPGTFKWQDDARLIGLHAIDGRTELLCVRADSGDREVLAGESGVVGCFDVAGDTIIYSWCDYTHLGELYRAGRRRPLSRLNTAATRRFDIVPERWRARTERGVEVDTFLWVTPAQLRRRRRHSLPLIVYVHGGPTLQTGETPFHEYAWLAHEGYPVVTCNPRGSVGYGAEHGAAIYGNWGDRDAHDVLAVRRDVLRRYPQLDPARTFMVGGSYGGFMTNWLLTRHPGVFRAGVSQRSISNHVSFAGTSDFSTYFLVTSLGIQNIWEDPARAWEMSPISRLPDVRDPLLLIHSENDLRCPVGQTEEMFIGLVDLGRAVDEDVRFVLFQQESHGLSRGGKTDNRRRRLNEILSWIRKHDRPRTGKGPRRA